VAMQETFLRKALLYCCSHSAGGDLLSTGWDLATSGLLLSCAALLCLLACCCRYIGQYLSRATASVGEVVDAGCVVSSTAGRTDAGQDMHTTHESAQCIPDQISCPSA
jgi:hypothetical protein